MCECVTQSSKSCVWCAVLPEQLETILWHLLSLLKAELHTGSSRSPFALLVKQLCIDSLGVCMYVLVL